MTQSPAVAELADAIAELQSYANTNDEADAVHELVQLLDLAELAA